MANLVRGADWRCTALGDIDNWPASLKMAVTTVLDACLLDIGLPEMDGNALARRLRAMPEMAHAVLIAVTDHGQQQDQKQGQQQDQEHACAAGR